MYQMVLVKRFLCLILALTAITLTFLKAPTKMQEMAKNTFLFGYHLRSSTINGLVNHFGICVKFGEFRKLLRSPNRWRLLYLTRNKIVFLHCALRRTVPNVVTLLCCWRQIQSRDSTAENSSPLPPLALHFNFKIFLFVLF